MKLVSAPSVPRPRISRRTMLRASGVAMALPMLDAMTPLGSFAKGGTTGSAEVARRLIAIQTTQGIMPHLFFPENTGAEHPTSPYLDLLGDLKGEFTIFSGVSHPGVDGGHANEKSFLTGAPHPAGAGFRNSVSLDQYAADRVGSQTRFKSVVLSVSSQGGGRMSYTSSGVMVPSEVSPANLYRQLFVQGDEADIAARMAAIGQGRSLLDFVSESAVSVARDLGTADRDRLDQYFTSIRELEEQFQRAAEWEQKPKPVVSVPMPEEVEDTARLVDRLKSMLGVMRLAIETDSARVVSLWIEPIGVLSGLTGVKNETHSLTHHGNRQEMIDELRIVEEAQFRALAEFLSSLRGTTEGSEPLLDRTIVMYGTCMGNANGHTNSNWPILLAGGGFKHVGHLAFDRERNYPLGNLFVSILQQLGIEAEHFASGTGTMKGLAPR